MFPSLIFGATGKRPKNSKSSAAGFWKVTKLLCCFSWSPNIIKFKWALIVERECQITNW